VLGDIGKDNLKDLIIAGAFDEYWELSKEKITGCKECELRFACDDCRVLAFQGTDSLEAKPPFCNYNPHTGQEENSNF
ncbi:MAG: radical SAM protein, partial [bacterium]|nr:radical SAM protein [bacterium]